VEFVIPKPLPFIRLGLANLPLLLALRYRPTAFLLRLVILKVLGQALIQGSLFSYVFLFSLAGSAVSGFVMIALIRTLAGRISLIGVSVAGALGSNMIQIALAATLVFGRSGWLIAPVFLTVGLISSTLLGAFAEAFLKKSRWAKIVLIPKGAESA
jgi:uncharacterized membrane protein